MEISLLKEYLPDFTRIIMLSGQVHLLTQPLAIEKMKTLEKYISENWNTIKLLTLIIAIAGGFVGFDNYINNAIKQQITNKDYVNQISKSLRPFLIFDQKGIVIYDHGAAELISNIKVDEKNKIILVQFKSFVQNAPLLIAVSAEPYSFTTNRGKNNTWKFNVLENDYYISDGPAKPENNKYILEILK